MEHEGPHQESSVPPSLPIAAAVSGLLRGRECRLEPGAQPQGDIDEGDHYRHFDEGPDDRGEGLSRAEAEDRDGDRDGELEVVARRGEGERRRLGVVGADGLADARR